MKNTNKSTMNDTVTDWYTEISRNACVTDWPIESMLYIYCVRVCFVLWLCNRLYYLPLRMFTDLATIPK